MLRELIDPNKSLNLLYTNSERAEMFVYDTLKKKCSATNDSVIEVYNQSTFEEMLDLAPEYPILAKEWLFIIKYKKVKKLCEKYKGLFTSGNCVFLILVENFKEFQEFKELLNNKCNAMYMTYLTFSDINYLFYPFEIPSKFISFISKTYSRDIENIFKLYDKVLEGYEVDSIKSITEICGNSVGTTQSFVLSLLKIDIPNLKNPKLSLKRKFRELIDLSNAIGSKRLKGFLLSNVKDLIYIKQLYIQADIYDDIKNLPEGYDEKKLSRYQRYLNMIKEIPLQKILSLYTELLESQEWYKEIDVVQFLFNYYNKRRTISEKI